MTRKVSSYRLSDHTLAQIDAMSERMGSAANVISFAIDRMAREDRMINLIEDNAGHLFIGSDGGPWANVTGTAGTFAADAAALADGDVSDWTVEWYDDRPMGEIVATWDGDLHLKYSRGGAPLAQSAAREYIGPVWTDDNLVDDLMAIKAAVARQARDVRDLESDGYIPANELRHLRDEVAQAERALQRLADQLLGPGRPPYED